MLKKIKNVALLSFTLSSLYVSAQENIDEDLDVMVDFAYPISMMQSIRENLNQSLYLLQEDQYDRAHNLLQDAVSNLPHCMTINEDDRAYITAMIHHIQACKDGYMLADLCQQIENYF